MNYLLDLLEIIKSTLASGEDIMISGFGKCCVKEKAARNGRNPATAKPIRLAPRRVVTFQYSGKLKEKVNYLNRMMHIVPLNLQRAQFGELNVLFQSSK